MGTTAGAAQILPFFSIAATLNNYRITGLNLLGETQVTTLFSLFSTHALNSTHPFLFLVVNGISASELPAIPVEQFHLRNKFNFWSVHGIMDTSGLLQSET